jgi:hypothetical protein
MCTGGQKREMKGGLEQLSRASRSADAWLLPLAIAFCVFFALVANSHGQESQIPEPPLPVDPRPLAKLLSDSEKRLIGGSDNPKKLVDAYLKISDVHLQAAFSLIGVNNHGAAERELDVYNKAVAAAGKEAFSLEEGKRRLSKRIEQALYKQIKTLESIERLFPIEREAFAEAALRHTKQIRVQALNVAFDSGGVLKNPSDEKEPKTEPLSKDGQSGIDGRHRTFALRRTAHSSLSILPVIDARLDMTPGPQVPGDYLTDEEDEHVREAQAPDARAKVFMKIADRRLKAIVGSAASPVDKKEQKKVEEEEREWGAVPKVGRTELLRHYARAISECMAKLEDAYERNPKSTALPKALAVLRDATDTHLQMLRALKSEMTSDTEVAAISGAIYEAETANQGARDGLK